jgi:hypothetical protein
MCSCPVSETKERVAAILEVYTKGCRMNLGMTKDPAKNKFDINNTIIYMALDVLALLDHLQRLENRSKLLYNCCRS